jgi:outer membrane protein insertion porin family
MRKPFLHVLAAAALAVTCASEASAQAPTQAPVPAPAQPAAAAAPAAPPGTIITPCGNQVAVPSTLPPAGSGPVVWILEPCFPKQGNTSSVESETYMYYIKLRPSQPSQGVWVPYNEATEQTILNDFKSLWGTKFLEDLSIEKTDYTFPNGTVGEILTYNMEERERIKIVEYKGSKQIDRTKIEEQLRDRGIEIRLDSFLDDGTIRRVEGVLRTMMAEKGFTNAEVSHTITPVAGGPKLVNIAFNISEGPKIKIRDIEFVGNKALSDGTLQRKMKENKPKGLLSFITGTGTYKQDKFEEDAQKVVDYYRTKGYVRARVGQPELKVLENTKDGKTRWVQLRIPITEGPRYKVGSFSVEGNTVAKTDQLLPLFKVKKGEWYDEKDVRDGLKKAQEIYGAAGYMEFTGFPDLKMSDDPEAAANALAAQVPEALAAPPDTPAARETSAAPTVDVTMRLTEGKQYFVNKITFTGNTTTRDNVIRRELRVVEGAPFNTEALKFSVRRLNQLGYFKPLEGNDKDLKVEKTPGKDNQVDVTLKFEEQNRNQLTFGAGVSQYEGVFGQVAFQTSNFMGRGESLTVSVQAGDLAQNYQLAFTEPYLFDRAITGGFDVFKRSLQYIGYYTQDSTGGNLTFGFPAGNFSRMFLNYEYQQVGIRNLSEALIDSSCLLRPGGCSTIGSLNNLSQLTETQLQYLQRNPFVYDSLLVGQGGKRTISKLVPQWVLNTVDNPIFPNQGKRYTASVDLAVLGGNTKYYKPSLEGVWFKKLSGRTSLGGRAQVQYITPTGGTQSLPIFERLWLGGEYSIRGFDLRSVGPTVPGSQVVLGGNKSLLFNAEYLISIVNQVRIVLFYDAGQVRDFGQKFAWKEDLTTTVFPPGPALTDPLATTALLDPNASTIGDTRVIGKTSAFKTSTGVELRFFMPVLNVPFRLIYAWNPQRDGVLDNSLRPAKSTTFRFAVGTTF